MLVFRPLGVDGLSKWVTRGMSVKENEKRGVEEMPAMFFEGMRFCMIICPKV